MRANHCLPSSLTKAMQECIYCRSMNTSNVCYKCRRFFEHLPFVLSTRQGVKEIHKKVREILFPEKVIEEEMSGKSK